MNILTRSFSPGDILAERYEVLSHLGSGGLGEVYRVKDTLNGGDLAMKLFFERYIPESVELSRIEQVLTQATPKAEGIIAPVGFVLHEQRKAVLMPYIAGSGLDKLISQSEEPLPFSKAAAICDAVAKRLSDIPPDKVHGDLKPGNVIIDGDLDGRFDVLVSDFGTTKLLPFSRFASIQLGLGYAYYYMAPEAVTFGGRLDRRSDIYALGMLFMHLITGQVPKRGGAKPSQYVADIPEELNELVMAACEKDPAVRLSDLRLFRALVKPFVPPPPPPEPEPEPEPEPGERTEEAEVDAFEAAPDEEAEAEVEEAAEAPEPAEPATAENATKSFLDETGSDIQHEAKELFGDLAEPEEADVVDLTEQVVDLTESVEADKKPSGKLNKDEKKAVKSAGWGLWLLVILALAAIGLLIAHYVFGLDIYVFGMSAEILDKTASWSSGSFSSGQNCMPVPWMPGPNLLL